MTTAPYTALERTLPTVPAVDLATSGTTQVVVVCPNCAQHHRHLGLGLRRSPCGTWYVIERPELQSTPAIRAAA